MDFQSQYPHIELTPGGERQACRPDWRGRGIVLWRLGLSKTQAWSQLASATIDGDMLRLPT